MTARFMLSGTQNITGDSVHAIMLVYTERVVSLHIDGILIGEVAVPDGVEDCGPPSDDCLLVVGQRVTQDSAGETIGIVFM